ncbi:unnamed protein product [Trichobilharzia szidati]|nr:unnamed protein product [Trichobilharzia szidati]
MDKVVIYKISCNDCDKHYIGQSGRPLRLRIHEHKLAVKRHDIHYLISLHADNHGHQFDWDNVQILDKGNCKNAREFLEAWYSNESAINRHIEIDKIYQSIRRNSHKNEVKLQVKETVNTKTSELESEKSHKNNQSRSRLAEGMTNDIQTKEAASTETSKLGGEMSHENNQSRSRLPEEMTNKLIENSKSPLHIEVCAEDVAQ